MNKQTYGMAEVVIAHMRKTITSDTIKNNRRSIEVGQLLYIG